VNGKVNENISFGQKLFKFLGWQSGSSGKVPA
jgi:hypothetical protein